MRTEQPALEFIIPGKPRTQGSLTLWRGADGKERAKHSAHTSNHRNLMVGLAVAAWKAQPPMPGDVAVDILATFARPATHYGTGRNADRLKPGVPARPITRAAGDADKVARLVLDALDVAGVYDDDSQVALLRIEKRYAEDHEGESTRVRVWGIR